MLSCLRVFSSFFLSFFLSLFWLSLVLSCKSQDESADLESNPKTTDYYTQYVQPIFDQKCVTCHSCNDAPCGLKLSSWEGFARGATKVDPYASGLVDKQTTRLFVDAKSAIEWRSRFFFWPVLSDAKDEKERLKNSPFLRLLNLKERHPTSKVAFDGRSRVCPGPKDRNKVKIDTGFHNQDFDEISLYENSMEWGGMPYGFPQLTDEERQILDSWVGLGAPGPKKPIQIASDDTDIRKWEKYLNGSSYKSKLTARYLYEHLFLARIHFSDSNAQDRVFRLTRSSTPTGKVVDEIPTRRPFDDPKKEFYYRFVEVDSTIVAKDHLVYVLNNDRLQRYNELFFDSSWNSIGRPSRYSSYDNDIKSNPYDVYAEIPAKSRYLFLLDTAEYFIRTFIRGPVCNGGAATNVINDHFWVTFLDPDKDPAVLEENFLYENRKLLEMPSANEPLWNSVQYLFNSPKYSEDVNLFNKEYSELFKRQVGRKLSVKDLWDGDGDNDNALLTVFRHFDSSTVQKGLLGQTPKTVWLLNYQILETIYYNLVANFDVYGNTVHKASTRIFMEASRMSSEHLFLNLLPESQVYSIRNLWNRDKSGLNHAAKKKDRYLYYPLEGLAVDVPEKTSISLEANQRVIEGVFESFLKRLNRKVYQPSEDSTNCFFCDNIKASMSVLDRKIQQALNSVEIKGDVLKYFPELSYIRITENGRPVAWYSMVKNTGHYNVAALFSEDDRINESESYINFIRGFIGSYPNAYFSVELNSLSEFMNQIRSTAPNISQKYMDADSGVSLSSVLLNQFVVGRYHSEFWEINEQAIEAFKGSDYGVGELKSGVFDLSRYVNVFN